MSSESKRQELRSRATRRLRISFLRDECGQDLVEYVIVAALISLAAIAGMRSVAATISNAFTSNATKFSTYTS